MKGRPYSCPTLRPLKGKEVAKSRNREKHLFDIFRVDQIFNHLLKDLQIKLLDGYKIPSPKELKNKKYCKSHHSFNHPMVNCVVFRNAIQKALKEGRFKLVDLGIVEMTIGS